MENMSSGCYMIDDDYNVVSVNKTAKLIYPQIKVGEKCYRCLSQMDEPCGPCPVKNKVKGPKSYRDPIRNIMETVDAVDIPVANHGVCHALIFSTVGDDAKIASTLPTNNEELRELALIKSLTSDFAHVFIVNLETRMCYPYRLNTKDARSKHSNDPVDFTKTFQQRVDQYIIDEDREMILKNGSLENIVKQLKANDSYLIHFRALIKGELHYYFAKFVRIGEADDFDQIVVGMCCEDESVMMINEMNELEKNLSLVEIDELTHLYTKEAFRIYGERMRHENQNIDFDFCVLKIENLCTLTNQYGRIAVDHMLEMIGNGLIQAKNNYTSLSYFGTGVFACYRQTMSHEDRKMGCEAFADMIREQSNMSNISIKWSTYVAPKKELTIDEIIENTNYALSKIYDANVDYVEFDQKMIDLMNEENEIASRLETALANHEIQVWLQPQIDTKTQRVVSAEALARWIKSDGTMISPGKFIPILEKEGKVRLLDHYVFLEACRLEKQLLSQGITLPISVNLSRVSVYDEDVASSYYEMALQEGNIISYLPIEITESAAVSDMKIQELANKFNSYGFELHMDDFGSGFSTLAALETLPFTTIKLDRSLIELIGSKSGESLLTHTVGYAKETGKTVIAEGVELKEQYEFLKRIGCDIIQGFYFAKPMCQKDFINLISIKGCD